MKIPEILRAYDYQKRLKYRIMIPCFAFRSKVKSFIQKFETESIFCKQMFVA